MRVILELVRRGRPFHRRLHVCAAPNSEFALYETSKEGEDLTRRVKRPPHQSRGRLVMLAKSR